MKAAVVREFGQPARHQGQANSRARARADHRQDGGLRPVPYSPRRRPSSSSTACSGPPGDGIGVTVNAVTPGYIATDMMATIPDKVLDRVRGRVPSAGSADQRRSPASSASWPLTSLPTSPGRSGRSTAAWICEGNVMNDLDRRKLVLSRSPDRHRQLRRQPQGRSAHATSARTVVREAVARAEVDARMSASGLRQRDPHRGAGHVHLAGRRASTAACRSKTPALTVNRLCGSGLQAIVIGGADDPAGRRRRRGRRRRESHEPRPATWLPACAGAQRMGDASMVDMMVGALTDPSTVHMGITAENVAANAASRAKTRTRSRWKATAARRGAIAAGPSRSRSCRSS